jgi:hypothetical protein
VLHSGLEAGQVPCTNAADANSGDVNSAAAAAAASAARDSVTGTVSDANSAGRKKGDGFSAKTVLQMSDVGSQSEAGSAKTNAARKSDGKSNFKIPSMCPPRLKPPTSRQLKLMPFPALVTRPFSMPKKTN